MGMWNFYFLGEFYLYFRGFIRFNLLLNALFLVFFLLPLPMDLPFRKFLKILKSLTSVVCALLLLWYESWLPSLGTAFDFLTAREAPSLEYIFRFLMNSINFLELGILLIIFAFCFALRKRIIFTPIVIFLMLIVLLITLRSHTGQQEDGDRYLDSFYQSEMKRTVHFQKPNPGSPDFDIVLIHICSLAWDDLKAIGMDKDPFFSQFDILFTNFNSVTAYSNPSAIRLLRSNCGQQRHKDLYDAAPEGCYLLDSLRAEGYRTFTALDHDGVYGHFTEQVMALGKADPPLKTDGIAIQEYDFDDSPIFDDLQVLEKWLDARQKSGAEKAALYFNAITLHSGSHRVGVKDWWKIDRETHYKDSVQELFKNIEKFFVDLSSSGRNVVVAFVPEHGMALRGSSIQAPDLRDIPLPPITIIPVAIKLIGNGLPALPSHPVIVSKPVSWMTVSYLLASFIKEAPFGKEHSTLDTVIEHIPETPYVSENEGIRIIKVGKDYWFYGKDKKWTKLSPLAVK